MKRHRQRGFSILEIAVVIAILGFLAFLIAPILSSTVNYSRLRETRVKLDPVKSAIVAFVAANPGDWLIHCHVLEHHAGGMGTQFRVA